MRTNKFQLNRIRLIMSILILATATQFTYSKDVPDISHLESLHKNALETGNIDAAKVLETEIMNSSGEEIYVTDFTDQRVPQESMGEVPQGDWLIQDRKIYDGPMNMDNINKKNIDMKVGEDGCIYAAVNVGETEYATGNIKVFMSDNNGRSWSSVLNMATFYHISSISMLIESRSNSVADSTRIIVFYTSSSSADFSNSTLNYVMIRRDGQGFTSGLIASPAAGNRFTHVSALSDGAYYQGATYIGVVCTELSNTYNSQAIRYFRSINWGASWVGASLVTGEDDYNPSAGYKFTGDSVFIAIERRLATNEYHMKLLATKFSPSSAFGTRHIAGNVNVRYEKPCIAIKQKSPVDTMLLVFLKNNDVRHHFSTNAGASWNILGDLTNTGDVRSVWCATSNSGYRSFSISWSRSYAGEISTANGQTGTWHTTTHGVNNVSSTSRCEPVCLTINNNGLCSPAVLYVGYGPQDLYFDYSSAKKVYLTVSKEALYNSTLNQLNRADTVTAYLRNYLPPYAIVDTARSPIDRYTFGTELEFARTNNTAFYVEVRTRNSISGWILIPVGNQDYYYEDLLRDRSNVIGSNQAIINGALNYYGLYAGDVNQDGFVDGSDTQLIDNDATAFVSGFSVQDLNGDNFVDGTDALYADNNAFNFVSVVMP